MRGGVSQPLKNLFGNKSSKLISFNSEKAEKTTVDSVGSLKAPAEIKLTKEETIFSSELKSSKKEESISSIQEIFTEIQRGDRVEEIQGKYEENLKTSRDKLKDHSEGYKSSAADLARYQDEKKVFKNISKEKRSAAQNIEAKFTLDLKKREALQNFYEEYTQLGNKKSELFKELTTVKTFSSEALSRKRRSLRKTPPSREEILNSLQQIGWKNREVNWNSLFTQQSKKETIWDSRNPLYFLLESDEERQEWIKEVKESIQAKDNYVSSNRGCGLLTFWSTSSKEWCYGELPKYEKTIADTKASIGLKIGEHLLKKMKRLH
ncbi:hypothetical protein, contains pleckstrin homology domain [Mycoplasma suis KI3806]|uniref:PH domain-containing protein n=1 Tax=Mycoplasma suis (strain KI_3806) TaxID=708248 RepID=F0V1Z2_MYCS3|nr:hypothetical protein [Mycoplasma suis]CBZ40673.1 hypothetical protein, contains pleckstrin homology domain [Mycoplasma suis KI3806]